MIITKMYACEYCGEKFSDAELCIQHEMACTHRHTEVSRKIGDFFVHRYDTEVAYKLIRITSDGDVVLADPREYIKVIPEQIFLADYVPATVTEYTESTLPLGMEVMPMDDDPMLTVKKVEDGVVTLSNDIYDVKIPFRDLRKHFLTIHEGQIAEIKAMGV